MSYPHLFMTMDKSTKDHHFSDSGKGVKFEFDEAVAQVFDDMLSRSVPYYEECQQMVLQIAAPFCRKGSKVYDLGCSTGSLLLLLAKNFSKSVELIGVDNSIPMLKKAREKLQTDGSLDRCKLIEADLKSSFYFSDASVVIMNYTLQFIPPPRRPALIEKIFKALNQGGCFILIEKMIGESAELDSVFVKLHHKFKSDHGYSQNEISRKREALENVLIPFTEGQNRKLLHDAGFTAVDTFFKWFNFSGFVSVRPRSEQ